ncbi:MAG TPA: hypothetical protein VHY22_16795 [Chthoniobacteraceae bacterium]|jgi:hypothetical protein|nr:hypothetical protein [Chthoniobacteraceae bacterium]
MKSSLAETFQNIADGVETVDRIFPQRTTIRRISDENGADLPKESVLVLPPYNEFFGDPEKTSTLLVNHALRIQFEKLHLRLNSAKEEFIHAMAEQSGSTKDIQSEITQTFTKDNGEIAFFSALERIKNEVKEMKDAVFAEIQYDTIFDDKVLAALESKDCKTAIKEYITRYNELLVASTYFKKGIFEYFNASEIAKTLAKNGFFAANHTVTFHGDKKLEISTEAELEKVVTEELSSLLK